MRISYSKILMYQNCPRQYWWHYRRRLRPKKVAIQLVVGQLIHRAIAAHFMAEYRNDRFDIVSYFDQEMQRFTTQHDVATTPRWPLSEAWNTGRVLVENFPGAWNACGLMPIIGKNGPLVECHLEAPIPGTNDTLHGYIDMVAMDMDGNTYVLDYKSPATVSDHSIPLAAEENAPFAVAADQLTTYQYLCEANRDKLGLDRVDQLGFMELIKRKVSGSKGPECLPPQIVPSRSESQVEEFLSMTRFIASAIKNNQFPRFTKMDFNSPCKMCAFAPACLSGDESNLIHSDQLKKEQANIGLFNF